MVTSSLATNGRAPAARLLELLPHAESAPESTEQSRIRPLPSVRNGELLGNDRVGAALLSGVAGYVDTAGFLALFGIFPAHLTGDLVTAGTALTGGIHLGVIARLLMIPLFMLSVAFSTVISREALRRGHSPVGPLLGFMTFALAMFCLTGVVFKPLANGPDAGAVILIGGTGVIAMGFQNALMRQALGGLTPTTIMTGNLTQFTIDLVELALPLGRLDRERSAQLRRESRQRLVKFGIPLAGFCGGATLGAWLTGVAGLWSISLPTVTVFGLTVATFRRSRLPQIL